MKTLTRALSIGITCSSWLAPLPGQVLNLDSVFRPVGGTQAAACRINNFDAAAGTYTESSRVRGFTKRDRTLTPYDYPGAQATFLADINDWGDIVGTAVFQSAPSVIFVLRNGIAKPLPAAPPVIPGGTGFGVAAAGNNNKGTIVGTQIATLPGGALGSVGFIYENGSYRFVNLGQSTLFLAINDRDEILGSKTPGTFPFFVDYFIYRDGVTRPIPGIATDLQPMDLNNFGTIVGADLNGQAFYLRDGNVERLAFPGFTFTKLTGINERATTCGVAGAGVTGTAFVLPIRFDFPWRN